MQAASRRGRIAVETVLDIAYHGGGQPVLSREVTERLGIPPRSLELVLQRLARAGILVAERGKGGGYRLGRERRRISVGDILRTVDDPAEPPGHAAAGSPLGHQVVDPLWREIEAEYLARLDRLSLDELCQRARAAGVASLGVERLDYTI